MIGGKTGKPATRLTLERGSTQESPEERDDVERRQSHLYELLERHGGKGRAKVYRVIDGENCYALSWPVDKEIADNLEERLAELGGGKYCVKLYWGPRCEASINFVIDAAMHPIKKTEPELKREGGLMPQTPAELATFMQQAMQPMMAAIVGAVQPRDDGSRDLIKLMLLQQQEQAREARQLSDRLLANALMPRSGGGAGDPKSALRETAEMIGLVDKIRGDGAGGDPARDERRSLASRIIEGPANKAAERIADRIVDKYFDEEDGKKKPEAAPVARPPAIPPTSPTTPVNMPRGIQPLSPAELARMPRNRGKAAPAPAATPAPIASEAIPTATRGK